MTTSTMWYVYILQCENNRLYTGISTNPQKRFEQHQRGKGAKFTRSNTPLALLSYSACPDRSSASKLEYKIKQLCVSEKLALVTQWQQALKPPEDNR
ncbi:MAG: GIY-YIG nuclease family protein [Moraxellaceae bacterium]|nr:GIY-YIG nuclease family protein [Moraxellaceae bacterium]